MRFHGMLNTRVEFAMSTVGSLWWEVKQWMVFGYVSGTAH